MPEEAPLGEATRRCAADIAALCNPDVEAAGEVQLGWRFFGELDADSLRSWRAQDLEQWRNCLSPQEWQRRFGIGDDQPYASVEQLLACTDWNDLITTVIPRLRP
ncbi:MAG: hypothetical protein FJ077_15155 [Cyanobacteria bacterium K_DeepCast_35m_m2_023]|nr:hypothetical protein [Cyanobacteria bacterium K_DeepCast_35m_m2_023]